MVSTVSSRPCTHGSQIRQARVGGLLLTEAIYRPGSWLAPHSHEHASMVFLLAGNYRERLGRFEEEMRPGMLYFREAGLVHSNMFGLSGARCLFIDHTDLPFDGPMPGAPSPAGFRSYASDAIRSAGERLAAEPWRDDAASRMIIHGLVLELMGLTARSLQKTRGTAPEWLARARERLTEESAAPPEIGALARDVGVHPSHFIRTFKRYVGVRPGQYLHEVRVARACRLLADPSRSLATIAEETGFADQSHFGRIFRRVMGTTPAAWRRVRR